MSADSISKEMLRYFNQLNYDEQKKVLQMIKTFLINRKDNFKAASLEAYNQELEQGDAEIDAGKFVAHEEFMKRYKKE
jgi:predicted transcriptional regulator